MAGPGGVRRGRGEIWADAVRALRRTGLFDEAWYLARYPDVALSGIEAALHYVKYGAPMGRDPGPEAPLALWRQLQPKLAAVSAHEALAALADVLSAPPEARPTPQGGVHRVVHHADAWAARAGDAGLARRLAEACLPAPLVLAAAIVEANAAARAGDRDGWARALNSYLADKGAVRFEIARTSDNVLAAVAFPAVAPIETGPLVSVIMPVWNAESTVGYAVRSILAQSWRPLELIVIDDASTDGTPAILRELAATDRRMTVLHNTINAGPYVSKNIGLMAARGDYITGHDADDLALPRRIERQVEFLRSGGHRCGFIGMLRMTAEGEVTRLGGSSPNSIDGVTSIAFISLMIERPLMRGIFGHWDTTRFGADSELDKRIMEILGGDLPRLHEVGMLVLDSPQGLTNHLEHGYRSGKISPTRLAYRTASRAWHAGLQAKDAWLPFPHEPRRFEASRDMLNPPGIVERVVEGHRVARPDLFDRTLACDVAIVTTLSFSGGNCSSTLDELRFLSEQGLDVRLVHCPIDTALKPEKAFLHSERYAAWADRTLSWYDIGRLRCRHLIVRHPAVATSEVLRRLLERIECFEAHFVINNATQRPDGAPVYAVEDLVDRLDTLGDVPKRVIPIGPMIRRDLEGRVPPRLLHPKDWAPTFDVADYALPAKATLRAPFAIGRHGRDGAEKWLDDVGELRAAYPDHPDFEIHILGGARQASKRLGGLPANWHVAEFGALSPKAFLEGLDVFSYFPHPGLREAFGRTVIEAMIASRPVILPPRFEETFGELAFYGSPTGVVPMVRALAGDWEGARRWLQAVQQVAVARYASEAISARLSGVGLPRAAHAQAGPLTDGLIAFKRRIEATGAAR